MVTQRSSKHLIRAYDSCIWYMAYFAIWTLKQKANSSLFNKFFCEFSIFRFLYSIADKNADVDVLKDEVGNFTHVDNNVLYTTSPPNA